MAVAKKTYFKSIQENFLIWLPLVAFAFVLLEVLGTSDLQFGPENPQYRFLINIFLLNSIHLVCPFLILAFWPSGREYVKKKMAKRRFLSWTAVGLCALFGFSVLLVYVSGREKSESIFDHLLTSSVIWIWAMVPLIHNLRQSLGISILMSKSVDQELAPEAKTHFQNFLKKERFWMNTFCVAMIVTIGFYFSDWNGARSFAIGFAAVSFTLAGYVAFLAYQEERFKNTNKFLFSLKFLMWPLLPFSVVALATITFCHALEYFALMQKSAGEFNLPVKKILATLGAFTVLVLFFEIRRYTLPQGTYYSTTNPLLFLFLASYPLLALAHYATDSIIYRFKDADVRQSFASFLVGFERR